LPLVAARAEREIAFAGEDDHAERAVFARARKRVDQLEQRPGPEGIAHLGPADRDLRNAAIALETDVLVRAYGLPVRA
jgi:hypothetical protein